MGGSHSGGASKGNQTYDSNGPDIRVRGNAHQVLEKYLQMARDAGVAGDRVAAENYLQHAEHYYRTIAAQNEGQRPRVGGRELSVADVNVQNVSQGLSAALYAAPVSAEALPGSGDQAAPASGSNGTYAEEDGDQFGSFNRQGFNGQGKRDHQNNRDRGNQDQAPMEARSNEGREDGRRDDGRRDDGRRDDGRGPRRNQRGPGRDGQRYDAQRQDGRQDGQRFGGQQAAYQDGGAAEPRGESRPADQAGPGRAGIDHTSSEQPDYPSELLTQPIVAEPAVQPPEAQPGLVQPSLALAPADEAPAAAEGEAAAPARRGRGRPRGTTTTRRTRTAAPAEGEAPTVPVDAGE
jgi:hypothetical protein